MVGRNQKLVESDDEIEILDERKTRKAGKQTKLKRPTKEPEKPKNSDSELFAEFDLEGVSEVEKEEIKRAILLSREEEKNEQIKANEIIDERKKEQSQESTSQQDVDEKNSADENMDFDDETQPPDSPGQDELNSAQITTEQHTPEIASQNSTRDLYDISTEVDERNGGLEETASPSLNLRLSLSQSFGADKEEQENRHCEEKDLDKTKAVKKDRSEEFLTNQTTEDREPDSAKSHQRPRQRSRSPSSERSQASGGFVMADGQGLADQEQKSASQESENSRESDTKCVTSIGEPLNRHYRNVRKQTVNPVKYFTTEGMDPLQCTKVIMQLFDIYAKNIRAAQSKITSRVEWGEPVKSGQHQSKTIDVKRRGQGSQYMVLSDSEEENFKTTDKQEPRDSRQASENDSSNLPDLERRPRQRLKRGEVSKKDLETAETQAYDSLDFDLNTNQNFEDPDDKDFCPSATVKTRKIVTATEKQGEMRMKAEGHDKSSSKVENKATRGRGRRKNKENKVLVEDTQKSVYDLSSDEETKTGRNEIPVVIEETQAFDVDENVQPDKKFLSRRNLGQRIRPHANNKGGSTCDNNPTSHTWKTSSLESFYGKEKKANVPSESSSKTNHGLSRRGRPKKNVVLVEDTQDLDEQNTGNQIGSRVTEHEKTWEQEYNVRQIRGKRKSFQLRSDSEEETIPESQEMDTSPNLTVIEKKTVTGFDQNKKDSDNSGSLTSKIGTVFQKVKEYLSPKMVPNEEEPTTIDNPEVNDVDSQSPVIKKRRKLYTEPNTRYMRNQESMKDISNDIHQEELVSSKGRRGIVTIDTRTEPDIHPVGGYRTESSRGGAGVKKLFSRPPSKESNTSDDISISNSQGSSTLLDEQGDLYSTQINEKPDSFRKAKQSLRQTRGANIQHNTEPVDFDSIAEVNKEDRLQVKSVKKDYRRKPNANNRPKNTVTEKNESISKFFSKVPKDDDIVNVDTDSDDSEIQIASHIMNAKHKASKSGNQNLGLSNEHENSIAIKPKNDGRKFAINVPNVKVQSENGISNDGHTNGSMLEKGKFSKEYSKLKSANDDSPVLPSQFVDQIDAEVLSTVSFGGARPKVPRTRKISETVTSGQLETNGEYNNLDEHRTVLRSKRGLDNQEEGGAAEPVRKKVSPVSRVSAVLMFPCPLCNQKFPEDIIQIHASECVGEEEEEEEEPEPFAQAINMHQLRRHPLGQATQAASLGSQLPHHCDHGHHPSNSIYHHHANHHLHDSDLEEEELQDLMPYHASQHPVHIEDNDVHDVAKDIKISPGEPGELQQCYICDHNFPKGMVLEQHIEDCLKEAKLQQLEVEKEGFHKVFGRAHKAAEPDTPRTTRRQLRNQENNNVNMVTIMMDPKGRVKQEEGIRRQ